VTAVQTLKGPTLSHERAGEALTEAVSTADRGSSDDGGDGATPAGPGPTWTSERLALGAFVAYLVVAVPVLIKVGSSYWFSGDDDWGLLVGRHIGSLDDLLRPQHEHWSTVPIVTFHALYQVFGLRTYLPYQLLVILLHLALAALVRVVMRRAGVGPWVATVAAATLVLFGPGKQDMLLAVQVSMMGSMVLGFAQLILSDHDGRVDRRDWLGLLAGAGALLCSGIGPIVVIVVGVATLLRRGWRMAMFHTAPLGLMFVAWYWHYRTEFNNSIGSAPRSVLFDWVSTGVQGVFGAIGNVAVISWLLGALLVGGLLVAWLPLRWSAFRRQASRPVALLVGVVVLFAAVANERWIVGVAFARSSRYVDMGTAFVLPALAVAADAIVRRWRWSWIPILALFLLPLPFTVADLTDYTGGQSPEDYYSSLQRNVIGAAYSPFAEQLPPDVEPEPTQLRAPGVTMGFLLEAKRQGKLPDAPDLSPTQRAKLISTLAIGQGKGDGTDPKAKSCEAVDGARSVRLDAGDEIQIDAPVIITPTLDSGPVGPTTLYPLFGSVLTARIPGLELGITPTGTGSTYRICRG
jgi:hypothetical protein